MFFNPYVYVTYGANVYCLDASTGTERWAFKIEGDWASSPVVDNGQVYVGSAGPQYFSQISHKVYSIDALTGAEKWHYTIKGNAASITVAGGVVYVGASFATTENPDFEGNGAVYALQPTTVAPSPSSSTIRVIVVVVVVVVLAFLFLVYRTKRKIAKDST